MTDEDEHDGKGTALDLCLLPRRIPCPLFAFRRRGGNDNAVAVHAYHAHGRVLLDESSFRHNVHDLEATARLLLEELGVGSFGTNSAGYLGSCRVHADDVMLTTEERQVAMETLDRLARKYDGRIQASAGPLANARMWRRMEEARAQDAPPFPNGGRLTACGCPNSKIAVRADGVIVPCCLLAQLELGRVGEDSLLEVWKEHPQLEAIRRRSEKSLAELHAQLGTITEQVDKRVAEALSELDSRGEPSGGDPAVRKSKQGPRRQPAPAASGTAPLAEKKGPKQTVTALIDAINSGDPRLIRKFVASEYSESALMERRVKDRVDVYLSFHEEAGEVTLCHIDESSEDEVTAVVQETDSPQRHRFMFAFDPVPPYKVYVEMRARAVVGGGEMRENAGRMREAFEGYSDPANWRTKVDWDWRTPEEINGKIDKLPLMKAWLARARGPVVKEKPTSAGQ